MKKVIVSVTNDLSTDQRVDKVCNTLMSLGFNVVLIGRTLYGSLKIQRQYATHRMSLVFNTGPLFYAEYNIRLFVYLLFHKAHLLVSNDLDTLLANFMVHKLKNIPMVYDSHEYYTGTPELADRPLVRKIWKSFEKFIFPKLKDIITVNHSIAALYEQEYGKKLFVVRNVPRKLKSMEVTTAQHFKPYSGKHLIILQGAGINIQRGAEEAVMAMRYVDNAVLLIIGGGDVIGSLKQFVSEEHLSDKVLFIPRQPYNELMAYTADADIGLTLDKDTNINYRFSLPNKLFDYIHAGTPVLASALPEIKRIIEQYEVGLLIDNHDPVHIATRIRFMLENNFKEKLKANLEKAASELNWENEEETLKLVYTKYV